MTSRVRMEPLTEIENVFCPQFDYIRKDREHILVPQFIDRYNNGHVRHKDKLDIYLNDQPIQTVLMVYQFDTEKFWYYKNNDRRGKPPVG